MAAPSSPKRYFITGATGLVGSSLVKQLLAAGNDVVVNCRPTSVLPCDGDKLRAVRCGLGEVSAADMAGCDVLVHLAAQMPVPGLSLEQYMEVNLTQTLHVFRTAEAAGVKRVIQIGSCSEFGDTGNLCPRLSPQSPLRPQGGYGVSKAMASLALLDWAEGRKIEFSLLRLFQIFGEGERGNRLWPAMHRAALRGDDFELTPGEQIRDFTPVTYTAERIIHEATRGDLAAGVPAIRQIGTGRPSSLRDFAEYWWQYWGGTGKLLFGAKPYRDKEAMCFVPEVEVVAPLSICPWIKEA